MAKKTKKSDGTVNIRTIKRNVERAARMSAKKTRETTQQLSDDGWDYGGKFNILEPPIGRDSLADYLQMSGVLYPTVLAKATAVHGMGHELVRRGDAPGKDSKDDIAANDEHDRFDDFLFYASPDLPWPELRLRVGIDKSGIGDSAFEIIRPSKMDVEGEGISGLEHLPTHTLRLCGQDSEPILADYFKWDRKDEQWTKGARWRRFRRFVQDINGKKRYFKELGDPRYLDANTGEYLTTEDGDGEEIYYKNTEEGPVLPLDDRPEDFVQANEIYFFKHYWPGEVYGLPEWAGNTTDIDGDRLAAKSTQRYLDKGGIAKLMIMASGAQLTKRSFGVLEGLFKERPDDAEQTEVIIVEAVGKSNTKSPSGSGAMPNVKLELEKLNDLQQGDALFREYRKDVKQNVREAMRLPGLLFGEADAANYATASILLQVLISFVVAPEQALFDWFMNTKILPELNIKHWTFKSRGPSIQDPTSKVKLIEMALKYAVIGDYETAVKMFEELLKTDLPLPDEGWTQVPPAAVVADLLAGYGLPTGDGEVRGGEDEEDDASDDGKKVERRQGRKIPLAVDAAADRLVDVVMEARRRLERRAEEELEAE